MRLFTFCNTCLSAASSRPARSLQYYVLLIRFLLLAIVIVSFIITALIGSVKVVGSIPDSLPERQTRFPDSASLGSRDERWLY